MTPAAYVLGAMFISMWLGYWWGVGDAERRHRGR